MDTPTLQPSYDRSAKMKAKNIRTSTSGRQKAEAPMTLKDIKDFLNLSEDAMYSQTVALFRALAVKMGHESLRQAMSGSLKDKRQLNTMLVASGIAYDKAWSKRENTAVLLAIPASIQAVIASSLGLVSKSAPKILPPPPDEPTE